ncbi:MAG: ATP-dependent Clp protease adaptor protein ClpS [Acidobacteriota bacterium]|jgi:ATP-dependent Clp protease adaptor protein ClpS|nr:ATP-dependent Clp protease adaptor protein ClpS [Acidobacteriota bacterium]
MAKEDFETGELTVAKERTRLKKPPLYKVLLHNDDFTTMEFVVYILQKVFQRTEADAVRVMLQVHTQGFGVAGVYTYEVAEMKAAKVTSLAQASEYPLLCTVEADESAG